MGVLASLAIKENIQTWFGRGFLKIQFQPIISISFVFTEDLKWKDYTFPFRRWGHAGAGPGELGKTLLRKKKRNEKSLRRGPGTAQAWVVGTEEVALSSIIGSSRIHSSCPKWKESFSLLFPSQKQVRKETNYTLKTPTIFLKRFFLHFLPRQTEEVRRPSYSLMLGLALTCLSWATMIQASSARGNKRKRRNLRVGSLEDTVKEDMGWSWVKHGKIQGPE